MSDHYDRYNGMENLLGTNLAEVGTDLISRQAAIETVMECYDNDELFEVYEDKLRELPPAQPERIRGRWILAKEQRQEDTENGNYMYNCSNCDCGDLHSKAVKVSYCWNCGAEMEVTT